MPPDGSEPAHPRSGAAIPRQPPPNIPDHELLRCIGLGGYGEVWLARNAMGTYRAVKVVYRDAFEDARPYERELDGIRNFEPVSRSHPGLVDVLQVGLDPDAKYFYYVMELADDSSVQGSEFNVQGSRSETEGTHENGAEFEVTLNVKRYVPKTLKSEIHRQGRLSYAECLRVSLPLADALEHLHGQGLIHRDIKPSNIIFVDGVPKLADVGLVTELGEPKSLVGTEGYMAPEGPGTTQADLYSLGKVFYEISTGKDRHRFPEPLTKLADLTDQPQWLEFNEVVQRACQPEPSKRYASTTQLRADLLLLQSGRSVRRLRLAERRLRWAIYAAMGIGVLAVATFLVQRTIDSRTKHRLLLEQSERTRLTVRAAGWSDLAWSAASNAGRIKAADEVKRQATATLAGVDLQVLRHFTNQWASSVAFDAQGERLLIGGYGTNRTRLFDLATKQLRQTSSSRAGPVVFGADGTPLQLTTNGAWSFVLWNVAKEKPVREFKFPMTANVVSLGHAPKPVLALSLDGAFLAAAVTLSSENGAIAVWDAGTGHLVRRIDGTGSALAFSPDKTLLAVGHDDGSISVWPLPDGDPGTPLPGERNRIESLAFCRDFIVRDRTPHAKTNWLVAAGDASGGISLWDLGRRLPRAFFRGSAYQVTALAFSPDGSILASSGQSVLRIWNMASGQLLLSTPSGNPASGLAFSPDGKRLAEGSLGAFSWKGQTYLWDLEHGRGIQSCRGLSARVVWPCVSPDGRWLAASALNWQVGLWDLHSGQVQRVIEVPKGKSPDNVALAFSPDSRQLAYATAGAARLWDVVTGEEVRAWEIQPGLVEQLAFDESGHLLLFHVETRDKTDWPWVKVDYRVHPLVCRLFDLSSATPDKPRIEIPDFNQRVADAVLGPDGRYLVVSGEREQDGRVEIMVKAYDPLTASNRWTIYPVATDPPNVVLDPTGRHVSFLLNGRSYRSLLVDLTSDSIVTNRDWAINPLGPGAERWVTGDPAVTGGRGRAIMVRGRPTPLVVLGIDTTEAMQTFARFDVTGRYLAWGHDDGTVLVADLDEIRLRLKTIRLGW